MYTYTYFTTKNNIERPHQSYNFTQTFTQNANGAITSFIVIYQDPKNIDHS